MVKQSSCWRLVTLSLALSLELLSMAPLPVGAQTQDSSSSDAWGVGEASDYSPPPDLGTPTRTESGSTRPSGPEKCPSDRNAPNPPLAALMPKNANVALTLAARPTFFFYIPQTSARKAKFVLQVYKGKENLDANPDVNEDGYQSVYTDDNLTIPNGPGVISFTPKENAPQLEVGKNYRWVFQIQCGADNSGQTLTVEGSIWRTQLRPSVASQLQKVPPRDRAKLYRQYKIWHEALTSLAELRRSNPNDAQLAAEWKNLFTSAGLREFGELPLVSE